MNTDAALQALKTVVVASYTNHTVTRGGVVKRKTAAQKQLDMAVAQALVAFAVDYDGLPGYRTPGSLWSFLVEWAKDDGDLVTPPDASMPSGFQPLQHRLDYQLVAPPKPG
ncbi:hypothetical protein [Mycobacterium sp. E796]|uniref:hypothetical protein n=1 Tax=Mycobacterium sp. E796 TaxID=1834151 RepID=UPI0007FBC442|nr:hypothetical protein [Mycobacterium sp. E796]OBI60624.1 hypothetical protein A5706_17405 [Mycobacterium sp. E796]